MEGRDFWDKALFEFCVREFLYFHPGKKKKCGINFNLHDDVGPCPLTQGWPLAALRLGLGGAAHAAAWSPGCTESVVTMSLGDVPPGDPALCSA